MPRTIQQAVDSFKAQGFTGQEIKDQFKAKYGKNITDFSADDDYDKITSSLLAGKASQKPETSVGAPTPASAPQGFLQAISPYAVRQPARPAGPTAPAVPDVPVPMAQEATETRAPAQPAPAPEGPTISAAKPVEDEPWYKTGARVLLPKAFGIEEGLLGKDPEDLPRYDKAKVEADVARYSTIKPGQYEFRSEQLLRPLGFAAGALSEVGKLGVELGAGVTGLVTGKSTETERAAFEKAVGVQKGDLEPKATKRVFRALGGPELVGEAVSAEEKKKRAEEEEARKYFPKPSLPRRVQEDLEDVVPGIITFLATDIFPILPSKEAPKTSTATGRTMYELEKAAERGEEFPASTGIGLAYIGSAAQKAANGDFQGAYEKLTERPVTSALTLLPFVHAMGPKVSAQVSNWVYDTIGQTLRAVGGKPSEWGATLSRWVNDPFQAESQLKSARAENIYQQAQAAKAKTRRATQAAVSEALGRESLDRGFYFDREATQASEVQRLENRINYLISEGQKAQAEFANKKLSQAQRTELTNKIQNIKDEATGLAENYKRVKGLSEEEYAKLLTEERRVVTKPLGDETFAGPRLAAEGVAEPREAVTGPFVYGGEPRLTLKVNPETAAQVTNLGVDGRRAAITPELQDLLGDQGKINPITGVMEIDMSLPEYSDPYTYRVTAELTEKIMKDIETRYPDFSSILPVEFVRDPVTGEITRTLSPEQLAREISLQNIVGQAVFEAVEDRTLNVLRGTGQEAQILRRLVAEQIVNQGKFADTASKTRALEVVQGMLEGDNPGQNVIVLPGVDRPLLKADLINVAYDTIQANKTKLQKLAKDIDFELYPENIKQVILDRVVTRAENAAFKEGLKQGFANESVRLFDDVTGQDVLADTPENVAKIVQGIKETRANLLPLSVRAGNEASFQQVLTGLGGWKAEALSKYVKPSETLRRYGFSEADFVDPMINNAYTSLLSSMEKVATFDQGIFSNIVNELKRGFTSRNVASALNNFKSNQLLYTMYYGLSEGVKTLYGALGAGAKTFSDTAYNRFVKGKPTNALEAAVFEGIQDAKIMDSNAAVAEGLSLRGGLFGEELMRRRTTKTGELPGLGDVGGGKAANVVKKYWSGPQDSFYSFGDNYFKFQAAMEEAGQAKTAWDKLAEGDTATIRSGKYGRVILRKTADGGAVELRPTSYKGSAAKGTEVPEPAKGTPLKEGATYTPDEVMKIFGKEGSYLAGEKFVDFNRVPQYTQWLRSGAGGAGGLVSLFTTWSWKMMDIPFLKKGIISHFLESPSVILDVEGAGSKAARSYLTGQRVQRGANRAALIGVAQQTLNRATKDPEQRKILQRMLAYEKGSMSPFFAMISDVDPFQAVYTDNTSANFMGPSDIAHRVLLSGAVSAGDYLQSIFTSGEAAGIPKDVLAMDLDVSAQMANKEDNILKQELRRLYSEKKSGQLLSPRELASGLGLRGAGPLFDLVSLMADKKTSFEQLSDFGKRTMQQYFLGGTGKKALIDYAIPELQARYQNATPEQKALIYADWRNNNAALKFNPDNTDAPFVERFIDGLFGIGYRTAYLSQYGSDGATDIGKIQQWADQYHKSLKNGLEKEYKERYENLVNLGAQENDPKLIETTERYNYLINAVENQYGMFLQKLQNATLPKQ